MNSAIFNAHEWDIFELPVDTIVESDIRIVRGGTERLFLLGIDFCSGSGMILSGIAGEIQFPVPGFPTGEFTITGGKKPVGKKRLRAIELGM